MKNAREDTGMGESYFFNLKVLTLKLSLPNKYQATLPAGQYKFRRLLHQSL